MKTSKFFLSTLVAAAAMTSTAYADSGDTLLINFASGRDQNVHNATDWINLTGNTGTDNTLLDNSASIVYTANNSWDHTTNVKDDVLKGYLDDGNGQGVSITVHTSFLVADVTIYCATDTASKKFTAKQINGVYYTHSDGKTIQGEAAWGASWSETVVEGTNALTVSGVLSDSISIFSPGANWGDRGCIAGLKIVETSVQKTFTFAGEDGLTWTSTQLGATENSWVNASATNGWTYADITLNANSAVSVEENVSAVAIFTSGTGTLTFNGTGSIDMPLLGTISAGDGTSIVFNNTLNFTKGGTISGSVSFGDSAKINVNGGSLAIAGADSSLASGPQISIADGAEVELVFAPGKNLSAIAPNVTGAGTLAIVKDNSSGTAHDRAVDISGSTGFSGALKLTGNFMPDKINAGNASEIVLDGVWFWSTGSAEISKKVLMAEGATNYTNSGTLTFSGNVSGDSFDVRGGTVTFSGGIGSESETLNTLNISGGTTTISGTGTNTIGNIRQTGGVINVNGKTSATQFVGTSTGGTAGTLDIGSSGVLTITGNSNSVDGNEGSFQLAHWPNKQTVKVGGALNLQNAGISNRDGNGDIYVNSGGEVNFNAGFTVFDNGNTSDVIRVHLAEGGRINVGTGGITNSNVLTLNLNGGTIGSLTDLWSSARALTLGGGVTIDTTKMAFNASGKATETSDGSSIELSGVLSGEGSLTKTGAGTLTLSGENGYTGGTTISEGTLIAESADALGDGDVTVSGGQLDVNNVTISNAINIVLAEGLYANTAAVIGTGTLSENIVVNAADLNALTILEDVTYKLWDGNALVGDFENQVSVTGLDSTWKYDVSEEGIFTLYAPIPEPSAFGLLAGVGALALVAARRRRRK